MSRARKDRLGPNDWREVVSSPGFVSGCRPGLIIATPIKLYKRCVTGFLHYQVSGPDECPEIVHDLIRRRNCGAVSVVGGVMGVVLAGSAHDTHRRFRSTPRNKTTYHR